MGRETVKGRDLPGPRLTGRGAALALMWLGPPAAALVIAADLLGWWIADALWGVCFGLVCLL